MIGSDDHKSEGVLPVGESAARAGAGGDENDVPVADQHLRPAGRQTHAVLVRLDFLHRSDDHGCLRMAGFRTIPP